MELWAGRSGVPRQGKTRSKEEFLQLDTLIRRRNRVGHWTRAFRSPYTRQGRERRKSGNVGMVAQMQKSACKSRRLGIERPACRRDSGCVLPKVAMVGGSGPEWPGPKSVGCSCSSTLQSVGMQSRLRRRTGIATANCSARHRPLLAIGRRAEERWAWARSYQ